VGGIYLLSNFEQDNELNNRYKANKILKPGGEGNEYFNLTAFGNT